MNKENLINVIEHVNSANFYLQKQQINLAKQDINKAIKFSQKINNKKLDDMLGNLKKYITKQNTRKSNIITKDVKALV